MRRFLLPTCVAAALIAGCKSAAPDPPYPNDPLLLSQKPIEGKLDNRPPVTLVHREPVEPLPPSEALVKNAPAALALREGEVDVLAHHVNKD